MVGEIISLVFSLIVPELLIWIPVLLIVGYLLKHATSFPNEFIAILILVLAVIIAALYGIGVTTAKHGAGRWITAFAAYGLGQGFLLTFSTVFIYDVMHGIHKYTARKKVNKATGKEAKENEA